MDQKKKDIIENIKNTYCRLMASSIAGVGVFAIRDIPKGINPFKCIKELQYFQFNLDDFGKLDKEVYKMVDDFFVIEKDKTLTVPENGLNCMDISFFVNHSDKPNMVTEEGRYFITSRKVKKGEEMTVGYDTYDYKYENK